jgi:hypothetical protein
MNAQPVDIGVSIADAEDISLSYDGVDLTLRFTDWREVPRTVIFYDAVALKWQRTEEPLLPGEQPDGVHVVADSHWLTQHRDHREAGHSHRHLKLNFNAWGVLEVICLEATLG